MATSDSLVVYYALQKKRQVIPISIALKDDIIFSFNEHETIILSHQGTEYQVRIECFNYMLNNTLHETTNTLLIGKDNYVIADASVKELGYNPDIYKITFLKGRTKFDAFFNVTTNSAVSSLGLTRIKEELENLKPGITYDRFRSGKTVVLVNNYISTISLIDNWEKIKLNLIKREAFNNIKNYYLYQNKLGKSNYKSLVKELIKPTDKFLNVIKVISKSKNRSSYVTKILEQIKEYEDYLTNTIAVNKKYLESLESVLEDDKTSDILIAHINENINNEAEAKKISHEIKKMAERLIKIREISLFFRKEHEYDELQLARIYTNIISKSKIKLSSKSSSLLFELYGFVILKEVLEDLGFTCLNLADFKKLQTITNDTTLYFRKDTFLVKVIYEGFIKHYTEANPNSLACVISKHNKPDYSVMFYDNDTYLTSVILEIKYRNLYFLFNNKYDQTVENCDNYAILLYKDKNGQMLRNAVKEVILINPDKEERKLNKGVNSIFLGYNLDLSIKDTACYKYLKNSFKEVLTHNV